MRFTAECPVERQEFGQGCKAVPPSRVRAVPHIPARTPSDEPRSACSVRTPPPRLSLLCGTLQLPLPPLPHAPRGRTPFPAHRSRPVTLPRCELTKRASKLSGQIESAAPSLWYTRVSLSSFCVWKVWASLRFI